MMKKRIIRTNNKEIYEKFNMLKYAREVAIKDNGKSRYVNRIVKCLNNGGNIIDVEKAGNYIIIKRKGHLNFDIYFK
jgi:hypothetical protein